MASVKKNVKPSARKAAPRRGSSSERTERTSATKATDRKPEDPARQNIRRRQSTSESKGKAVVQLSRKSRGDVDSVALIAPKDV
jgi:hypothetical protein